MPPVRATVPWWSPSQGIATSMTVTNRNLLHSWEVVEKNEQKGVCPTYYLSKGGIVYTRYLQLYQSIKPIAPKMGQRKNSQRYDFRYNIAHFHLHPFHIPLYPLLAYNPLLTLLLLLFLRPPLLFPPHLSIPPLPLAC